MAKVRTSDGRLVDPFNLTAEDMIPEIMIHSVCQLNRFNGHAKHPYSVGQHSLNLSLLVPEHLRPCAVIHDFSEAFFNDLAAPVKYDCPTYVHHEGVAELYIMNHFGIAPEIFKELKDYDKRIYVNERDALFPVVDETGMGDDRERIDTGEYSDEFLFGEVHWSVIKKELTEQFRRYFPDYRTST